MARKRRKEVIYSIKKVSDIIIERLEDIKIDIKKNYLNLNEKTIDFMLGKVNLHIDLERDEIDSDKLNE